MKLQSILDATMVAFLASTGCSSPGRPSEDSEVLPPNQVIKFHLLYSENGDGCQDADGNSEAAIALASPVVLAIDDDTAIRHTVADGVRATAMPAFAQTAGGMLTDKQVHVLVNGI